MSCKPRQLNKFFSFLGVSLGGTLSFSGILIHRGDEGFYRNVMMPVVSRCRDYLTQNQASRLETRVFNITFTNPIGLAAGFDKNSQALAGLPYYGLGFAEVGTVTPRPQDGNPKIRIFRAPTDKALVNRCGFNNKGIDHVADSLSRFPGFERPMVLGLNLGKNKDTEHISSDYLVGLNKSKDLKVVDYLVINISSPNTPGLRDIQHKKNLEKLLDDVLTQMNICSIEKPLLVKLAPDLSDEQIKDIARVLVDKRVGKKKVSGVILTNTTVERPKSATGELRAPYHEAGGLSGPPLRDISTQTISKFYKCTKGELPIVGVGGVSTGEEAYEKIKAGASLIQLYTGLTYEGPPIVNKIKRELVILLERDNLASVSEAVGLNHKNP